MTVFIRGAPLEDNTASECIRTVDKTYGYKLLQLSEYEANEYGYEANKYVYEAKCECYLKNTSSQQIIQIIIRSPKLN